MDKEKEKSGKDFIGVGGGVLIFNKKGEVLLKKRSKNSRNEVGHWEKPGGRVHYGERSEEAMRREIKEEVDLQIDIWGLLPHSDHILNDDGQHWLALNYLADAKSGEARNMEPDKADELKWFSLDELPENLAQPTRESVENFLKKKFIKL